MDVGPIRREEVAAVARLWSGRDDADAAVEALLSMADAHGWNPMRQVVARTPSLVGAIPYFPLADGSWLCDAPRTRPAGQAAVEEALLAGVVREAGTHGVPLVRLHAEEGSAPPAATLARAGWRRLTTLLRLSRPARPPLRETSPHPLTWEERPPDARGDLLDVLHASQAESLDVPEFGPRSYASLDFFLPGDPAGRTSWHVARTVQASDAAPAPAGCLLVNLLPSRPEGDPAAAEIRYMGLIPAARGRGCGMALAARAIAIAREAGAAVVRAAVDDRNTPACRTYAAAGFREYGRFDLWIARP